MKKICVVTGTRAEYGLLRPLMERIKNEFELQLVVTGMHLSPAFGSTYRQIDLDIQAKVDLDLRSDKPEDLCHSVGVGVERFGKTLGELRPDLLVVLGDRFEILAAAQAAMFLNIPIAHIHGGEATEGLVDEAIRHALTKMSQLHFVAAEPYRRRVIQMGESPERVFQVGAMAIDAIQRVRLLSREELAKQFSIVFGDKNILVTYHPVTLVPEALQKDLQALFGALDQWLKKDHRIFFTKANADSGGWAINQALEKYHRQNPSQTQLFDSLGSEGYFSLIAQVDLVLGNSSSGLIEVPFFKKATVNVGNRQKGRLRASSVIDSGSTQADILAAIHTAYSETFQRSLSKITNPYAIDPGSPSEKIVETLKRIDFKSILEKKFHDLPGVL